MRPGILGLNDAKIVGVLYVCRVEVGINLLRQYLFNNEYLFNKQKCLYVPNIVLGSCAKRICKAGLNLVKDIDDTRKLF